MDHSQVSEYMLSTFEILNKSFEASISEKDFLELPREFRLAEGGQAEYLAKAIERTRKAIGLPEALNFYRLHNTYSFAAAIFHLVKERTDGSKSVPTSHPALFTDALKVVALAYTAVTDEDFTDVLKHHTLESGFLPIPLVQAR